MEREDLIAAAEDLNSILFTEGDPNAINVNLPTMRLTKQVREAALWLMMGDVPEDETVALLKEFDWNASDFKNLKKDQDPLPLFKYLGIPLKGLDEEIEEEPEEEPEPTEEESEEEEMEDDSQAGEVEEEPPPETEPEDVPEYIEKAPPKPKPEKEKRILKKEGPSAYGTALALLGPDPKMPIHDLYEQMKDLGFDLGSSTGSIKTAHSIFRKVYRYLKENGHIKQGH